VHLYRKGMNLEEIYDVQGLRLIMNTKEDCYKALKTVHRLWSRMSASIKDYIIHPKENG
jgi:(p)ppGpp synthase/HD superfamily hydrolase